MNTKDNALRMAFEKLAKEHDLNLEPSIHEPENYASSCTNNYWWFYQDVIESQKAALSDAVTLPDGCHTIAKSSDGDIAVSPVVASQLIAIRDELTKGDIQEAYHLLYGIADPNYTSLEPWKRLEEISMIPAAPTLNEKG